ncbi:MAG: class I SAM-dependent methyltransferase, partial [Gammaproteobacteria bacterium]|nr:class I SAM-dependent methyltransferase [Gammaproteobacteria bacterium]
LGAASGTGSEILAKSFARSRVLSVDVSGRMLARGAGKRRLFSKIRQVQADALQLPLPNESVALVVANMLLPWIDDPAPCFSEVNRVLRKDAVFAFASLGPDSMAELREAADGLTEAPVIREFPDMHDVGDALVRAGLRDPVLDVDRLRITWPTFDQLLNDLVGCGAIGPLSTDAESRFRALEARFPRDDETGLFAIELELVFGHAWGSGPRPAAGEYRLEPGAIGRRARP